MKRAAGRTLFSALALGFALMASLAAEEGPRDATRAPFVIGVEDSLNVFVYQEPDLSGTVTVRPDGKITVPLVGDIVAEGLTPPELGERIAEVLGKYVKDPVVTVSVQQINHYRIYVLGEVAGQGRLDLNGPTRFLEAIAQAGGLSQFADRSDITILRYQDGKEIRISVDYRKILNGKEPNPMLEPGDIVLVR